MLKRFSVILTLTASCWTLLAIEERHGVLVGAVLKLDEAAKTMVVKAADGGEHAVRFAARTTVHGAEGGSSAVAKGTFHGLKEGSEVAVHYTAKGTVETADEVDKVGKDGLKASEVTVVHLDRGARTVAVKTGDGAAETYRLTEHAARDAGKDIGEGAGKSGKVTVYYSEEAGHKVAHFLKALPEEVAGH